MIIVEMDSLSLSSYLQAALRPYNNKNNYKILVLNTFNTNDICLLLLFNNDISIIQDSNEIMYKLKIYNVIDTFYIDPIKNSFFAEINKLYLDELISTFPFIKTYYVKKLI